MPVLYILNNIGDGEIQELHLNLDTQGRNWWSELFSDEEREKIKDDWDVRLLQQSAGCAVDGEWGPITVETVNASPVMLVDNFIVNRCQHYRDIVAKNPADQKYLTGWLARANA